MMKFKYVSRTVKILSFIFVVTLFLLFCQGYLFNSFNDCNTRWDSFLLEDENTIDVAVIGASETYNDFAPSIAYDKYGFTSFCLGSPNASCYLIDDHIKELLVNQTPELVLIEVNCFLYDKDSDLISDANIRAISDNIPLSSRKKDLINSVPAEDNILSYYFPFIKYHNTSDLGSILLSFSTKMQMQCRGYSLLKGIYTNANSNIFSTKSTIDVNNDISLSDLNPIAEEKLYQLLDYCKGLNTKVVFVRFPHVISSERSYDMFKRCNAVQNIVEDNGFEFINFDRDCTDLGLNVSDDFYNSEHMNIYGQQKFTKYFGKLITDKYSIGKTQLTQEQRLQWEKSSEYTYLFYEYVEKCMKSNNGTDEWIYETSDVIQELDKLKASKQ